MEYFKLFITVNQELIEGDINKKNRNKHTSRTPITKEFIEATKCMKTIFELFKKIKVISLGDVKGV
jgi:hypothetical protein